MRVIKDSDTTEFVDEAGDKLVLLVAPRQKDVDRCRDLEKDEALKQFEGLKRLGIDADKTMAEAKEQAPETLKRAEDAAGDMLSDTARVREFRLRALAVELRVSGDKIGGEAIVDAYQRMDPRSARWVDERVLEVWRSAMPSDADTRGAADDAGGAQLAADVTASECDGQAPAHRADDVAVLPVP